MARKSNRLSVAPKRKCPRPRVRARSAKIGPEEVLDLLAQALGLARSDSHHQEQSCHHGPPHAVPRLELGQLLGAPCLIQALMTLTRLAGSRPPAATVGMGLPALVIRKITLLT